MNPSDTFDCRILGCRGMTAEACVVRQGARFSAQGGVRFQPCGTGRCEQGALIRLGMPVGYKPPPYKEWKRPEELRRQSAARRRSRKASMRWAPTDRGMLPEDAYYSTGGQEDLVPEFEVVRAASDALPGTVVGQVEEEPMVTRVQQGCEGCGKPLRWCSVGGKCFKCRVKAGEVKKGMTRGAKAVKAVQVAPQAPPPTFALPDPASLPTDYLKRCMVEVAFRLQGRAA